MSGNQDQYDPTKMFQEWMKKGGKAQEEFMKMFASYLSQVTGKGGGSSSMDAGGEGFNPMQAFKDYASAAAASTPQGGTNFAESMSNMQQKAFENFMKFNQIMPNFLSWGSFKTSVGSNGRISIPEAEREALGIGEGNLVQVIVLPISKKQNKEAAGDDNVANDGGSGGNKNTYDDDNENNESKSSNRGSGSRTRRQKR